MATREDHQATRDQSKQHIQAHDWSDGSSDFVLVQDVQPPPRIELARERMLMCRLYLGLIQTISDDYGAEFVARSDSSTLRTVGIYVFLRTVMCSPVGAGKIAHALKLPRVTVLRRTTTRNDIDWIIWGDEHEVAQELGSLGARIRASMPLTLSDATLALLTASETLPGAIIRA